MIDAMRIPTGGAGLVLPCARIFQAGLGTVASSFLLHDTFTGSNGTDLTAHTMDVGGGWTADGGAGQLTIQGNACRFGAGGGQVAYSADAGTGDCTIRATITTIGNTYAGLIFRTTDINNVWFLSCMQSADFNMYLTKREAGGFANVAQVGYTAAPGDVIEVVLSGSSIQVYVDGVLTLSHTSAFNATATRHGIGALSNSDVAVLDDFEVEA